jgi:hypothetical protein
MLRPRGNVRPGEIEGHVVADFEGLVAIARGATRFDFHDRAPPVGRWRRNGLVGRRPLLGRNPLSVLRKIVMDTGGI